MGKCKENRKEKRKVTQMQSNGFLKNKNSLKFVQKAILAGIGVTTSKELIKKAAVGLYDDIQKIVTDLLCELEERGEIKTIETKHLIKELQKKSEIEKAKISKKLKKDSKSLINVAKDMILTPLMLANKFANKLTKSQTVKTKSTGKSKKKKSKR